MDFGLWSPTDPVEAELASAARWRAVRAGRPADLSRLLTLPTDTLLRTIAVLVPRVVVDLVDRGWRPADLAQIRSRRLAAAPGACLFDVLAEVTASHAQVRSDPSWAAELQEVLAGEPAGTPRPRLTTPTVTTTWPVAAVVEVAVDVLAGLLLLPRLPVSPALRAGAPPAETDAAVLIKVRALLAKAERTEFEHEAEAFTAKAQMLMARHSIDEAMLARGSATPAAGAALHRIWLDAPYVRAKFLLVSAVAAANRCEALFNRGLEVATVVGMAGDVRATVLLTTSLQLQAARAVARARPDPDDPWPTSVRSYRRSFLMAYAVRIGERLRLAAAEAEVGIDPGALLPVLADRRAVVARAVAEAFPRTSTLRTSSPADLSGWAAGRAAADLARLGNGPALEGTA